MKAWLMGIVGAALLASLAEMLCPAGRVKPVLRLLCALVCALAVAEPLMELDMKSLSIGLASYRQQAQQITESEEEEAKMVQRTYIQEECAAYILTQAEARGLTLSSVAVTAQWDEGEALWYPWEVQIDGAYSPALAAAIEEDLGVPEERQRWAE